MKNLNWLGRMTIFVVAEKVIAVLVFACLNFTIPIGSWFGKLGVILLGALYIDMCYGRIVLYSLMGSQLRRLSSGKTVVENLIPPLSLGISYWFIKVLSPKASDLLFTEHHHWSTLAVCQLVVSCTLCIGHLIYTEFLFQNQEETSSQ